tara:strand:+ start:282 stop:524 length:243 start_codon:yes stop_codon:yes gene_type:complete
MVWDMDKETLITIIREEIENVLQERSMSDAEIEDREQIVLNLKKKAKELKKRYGKDWKTVMYKIATSTAMGTSKDSDARG